MARSRSGLLISGSKVRVLDGPPTQSGTPGTSGCPISLSDPGWLTNATPAAQPERYATPAHLRLDSSNLRTEAELRQHIDEHFDVEEIDAPPHQIIDAGLGNIKKLGSSSAENSRSRNTFTPGRDRCRCAMLHLSLPARAVVDHRPKRCFARPRSSRGVRLVRFSNACNT